MCPVRSSFSRRWPASTETFFSDHSMFKFMFVSLLSSCQMSNLAGFCSLSEYLSIYAGDFIMKPHRARDRQLQRQFQQPDRKYFQWYCAMAGLTNYISKFFLAFHFPKSVLLLGSLWGGPGRLWCWITDALLAEETQPLLCQHVRVNSSPTWLICNSDN